MEFSLIHAGLAAGAALAAVPVILHLFMKQTPKHVIFPALRLIRERQKRSRKKLRIKNWLLLIARMLLVALMALALARPRFYASASLGDQEVPTALGLVFDTSLSMEYEERGKSRLDEAKAHAAEILKKLPDTSQVFVVDSAEPGVPVSLSPAAARKRIEALTIRPANRSMNAAIGQAYAAVSECDRPRHEVYVLTDLARSSWNMGQKVEGLDKVKKVKSGVNTFVLRLTPKEIRDVAIADAKPSTNVANPGEPVEIRVKLRSKGPETTRTAEFRLDGLTREKKAVTFPKDGEAEVRFLTPKLDSSMPLHQGSVTLSGGVDFLKFDDVRYFTFKVQPTMKVLLVSDQAVDAEFVADALDPDPSSLPSGTPRICHVDSISSKKLGEKDAVVLRDYTGIFLLNVAELTGADWGKLNGYVREGGGLIIGLGNRSQAENYNQRGAAQLIPATLKKADRNVPETSFSKITDVTHPLFARYHKELETLLSQIPVFHYWAVAPTEGCRTLLTYADGAPALIERTFRGVKTGRVMLWTTPLSRRADPNSPAAWNEFPSPFVGWSFLYLMNQTVPYLAGTSSERLNYEAGENATLPIDPSRRFKNYIVHSADGRSTDRLSPPVTSDSLEIVAPQPMGQWQVTASGPQGEKTVLGFSVNSPLTETQFVPLEANDLDVLFGKKNYQLADDPDNLKRMISEVRVGHEMFPWMMFLILMLVTAENFLANKFYRERAARSAVAVAA